MVMFSRLGVYSTMEIEMTGAHILSKLSEYTLKICAFHCINT